MSHQLLIFLDLSQEQHQPDNQMPLGSLLEVSAPRIDYVVRQRHGNPQAAA